MTGRRAGHVLFLVAAWLTCGHSGMHFLKAFNEKAPGTPLLIMVLFVSGWLCHFLGHYKALAYGSPEAVHANRLPR